ncbi:MAG: branched-chain amino acid aminotransferase [Myxococcota bacterium]
MNVEVVRTTSPRPRPEPGKLGFGQHFSDHVFALEYHVDRGWHSPRIEPYGPLTMDPGASVLHYAQAIFEGLKAFRAADGSVNIFRPHQHAERFHRSAERLCIPSVPTELFVDACRKLVAVDESWVPSDDGAALYLRPLTFATEAFLGVRPSKSYRFMVMTCPVGAYYAEGFNPVRIRVERERVRAVRGGVGDAKTAGNYAASLRAAKEAKAEGYAQVLWTDAASHRFVEEVGTMNVFFKLGDEVVTPALDGAILPGITRRSVIELLSSRGVTVTERRVSVDELVEAHRDGSLHEAFGTGTAAVVSPIAALGVDGNDLTIGEGSVGPLAQSLFDEITGIQRGTREDRFNWLVPATD